MTAYAELQVSSNFSFLRGASHAQELVHQAAELGYRAIGIADRNTLAGVVRAHAAAKECGIQLVVGARLDLCSDLATPDETSGLSMLCFPTDRAAYGRLSRLITVGKRRAPKGQCWIVTDDVLEHAEGQIFIALPPDADPTDDADVDISAPRMHVDETEERFAAALAAARAVLSRRASALSGRRRVAAGPPLGACNAMPDPAGRHQRRSRPRAGAPHPAGRSHLYPQPLHDR
jgi:DNA polymerase III alpha subunit